MLGQTFRSREEGRGGYLPDAPKKQPPEYPSACRRGRYKRPFHSNSFSLNHTHHHHFIKPSTHQTNSPKHQPKRTPHPQNVRLNHPLHSRSPCPRHHRHGRAPGWSRHTQDWNRRQHTPDWSWSRRCRSLHLPKDKHPLRLHR